MTVLVVSVTQLVAAAFHILRFFRIIPSLLLLLFFCSYFFITSCNALLLELTPPQRKYVVKLKPLAFRIFSTQIRSTSLLFASSGNKSSSSSSSSSSSIPFNAVTLVSKGMDAFREGNVKKSIELFDAAEDASNGKLRPYLWQRGISYYYVDEFQKGSDQFRSDVSINPLDVEEIVWDIACLNRLYSTATTSENKEVNKPDKMSLPPGKKDRRKIMGYVYSLFRDEGTEVDLVLAGLGRKNLNRISSDEFYSLFYLGLYCDSKGELTKAENYLKEAVSSDYAQKSLDYMVAVARVHCNVRGWNA